MARIEVTAEIGAPVDRVWEIVSDIDNEPRFWKGTKDVRNISREGDRVTREITIAFRDQKCMQEVTLEPKTAVRAVFTKGIIDGTKTVTLAPAGEGGTRLDVVWEIRLAGMMGVFTGMVGRHIRDGTRHALDGIRVEAEG